MTTPTVSKEREAFEQWANSEGLNTEKCLNGEYFYTNTRRTWSAWQARAEQAIASADEAQLGKTLQAGKED